MLTAKTLAIDKIKLNRQEIISAICRDIRDDLDNLLQDASPDQLNPICPARCSFGMRRLCDASMLGALYKTMLTHGVLGWLNNRMEGLAGTITMGVDQFTDKLDDIRYETIEATGIRTDIHWNRGPWDCIEFQDIMRESQDNILGFDLEYFKFQASKSGIRD